MFLGEDGTITTKTNTGDMVTCNLNSISLGRISDEELEENIALQIRMLDNVISINQAPVPESRMTSDKYRAIGLGTSGYHHYLVNHNIQWESDEHIEVADKLFENIAYYSIKACGVRQRHIDQAQSFNLYITPQMKAKEILDLYVEAYKQGICLLYTSSCV